MKTAFSSVALLWLQMRCKFEEMMKMIIKQNIGCLMTIEGWLFRSEGLPILVLRFPQ